MVAPINSPTIVPGSRLLLRDADWGAYTHFLKMFEESPGVRLTYDRGTLEIMSPSLNHDNDSRIFVHLVGILAEEWELPYKPGGSTTMRRKSKHAGLEADETFWLKNSPRMAGRRSLDLRRDPPPDLAIEVELRPSKVNRMSLYARLGVPEVWRLKKNGLIFCRIEGKKYRPIETSTTFPGLKPALVGSFLEKSADADDLIPIFREFRLAVRKVHAKS